MEVTKRDDVDFEITFEDVNDDPIDITGSTVFFTVKRSLKDADEDAVIAKEITVFDNPTQGIAIISLNHTDTNIPICGYIFDIQLKDQFGKIASSKIGSFVVKPDVTIRTT